MAMSSHSFLIVVSLAGDYSIHFIRSSYTFYLGVADRLHRPGTNILLYNNNKVQEIIFSVCVCGLTLELQFVFG